METNGRKPPQVKLDSDESIRIDNEIESDAAFFASDNAYATRQLDAVKPLSPIHSSRVADIDDDERATRKPQKVSNKRDKAEKKEKREQIQRQQDAPKEASPKNPEQVREEKKRQAIKKRQKRKKEQIRTFSHILGSVVLVVFILSVSAFLSQFLVKAFLDFTGITVVEYPVTVQIPPDATTDDIIDILIDYELIEMPKLFAFYSRISESDGKYLSGLFSLNSTMSYSQIVNTLQNRPQSTQTVAIKITEGMTALDVGRTLEENYVCRADDFMKFYKTKMNLFNFERRLNHNPLKFNQLEGYLFPDTHEFFIVNGLEDDPNMDTEKYAEVAARTIFSHFNSQMTAEIYKRIGEIAETLNIEFGLDEFITLASMVQLEASEPEDMRKVASVFFNRLRNPDDFPRLESDVSRELYGNDNILPFRTKDNETLIDNMILLYNTYESDAIQNGKLVSPPGPVCNPGMSAMLAVLDAVKTDYFYFCANIETGEVFFAENIVEHEENEIRAGLRSVD
ncbi:MAG: endolytic transglycosylase MltG [Oscillospiraceae bacterium]|nr:endolytic transglycosylase MltG [Oscillospiraceae bacterium]